LIFREVEDRDLIKLARRGEVDAFNALVSRWEKRVFNYLLKLLNRREDAQDVAQEVFLKAYQNLRRLEDADKFASWLFRIAHNEAYSLLRKSRPEDEFVIDPAGGDTLRRLYPSETALAVASALARLSADQREVVVLKVYQGFKFEEIADVLDEPVSTVKSRLYTAMDVLKDVLAPVERVAGRRSGDAVTGVEFQ
jgi:RNA polymerase sigma-70 factor (ECF subfamily)